MSDEKRSRVLLWVLIGGGAFFLFVLAVFTLVYLSLHTGDRTSAISGFGDKIGVVDLEGVIISPSITVPQLKKFADDDAIKATVKPLQERFEKFKKEAHRRCALGRVAQG